MKMKRNKNSKLPLPVKVTIELKWDTAKVSQSNFRLDKKEKFISQLLKQLGYEVVPTQYDGWDGPIWGTGVRTMDGIFQLSPFVDIKIETADGRTIRCFDDEEAGD
ncbi:MAG: hypothetical protein QXP60_05630 [Nitrososphaerota archaeon]